MTRLPLVLVCALGVLALPVPRVEAGFIGKACLKANRADANRSLCSCIDRVAKKEMTRHQRKRASKFFSDPHKAQVVRQSDRKSDVELWENYKAFSAKAAKSCS